MKARSIEKTFEDFWARVDRSGDCWSWRGGHNNHGYGQFCIDNKKVLAHRTAYAYFYGMPTAGMDLCHRCDNPGCVNPAHLFVGTRRDNMRDASTKGRMKRPGANKGEKNPRAKVAVSDVPLIRASRAAGETLRVIGIRYGISKSQVHSIASGKAWRGA